MSALTPSERAVRVAAAQEFSATGKHRRRTRLVIAGRRVRLDFAKLPDPGVGPRRGHRPHLRFDRGVVRVLHYVQTRLHPAVPAGVAVVFTLTAPIRLKSRTARALEHTARTLLARSRGPNEVSRTIHGNRMRVRLEKIGAGPPSAVIGFVHNVGTPPRLLFDVTRALLSVLWAKDRPKASMRSGNRWLVILAKDSVHLMAYRSICQQLGSQRGFTKVLVLFEDGSVESLL